MVLSSGLIIKPVGILVNRFYGYNVKYLVTEFIVGFSINYFILNLYYENVFTLTTYGNHMLLQVRALQNAKN